MEERQRIQDLELKLRMASEYDYSFMINEELAMKYQRYRMFMQFFKHREQVIKDYLACKDSDIKYHLLEMFDMDNKQICQALNF